ncbi:Putative transporter [Komagataella phaffii CBS 7435]|uniref:Transporter, member of the sugar porter family n=2 Tax=Komagataella phaffii TaxID=460519 RepID=C4R5V9_KOMPG|nr:Putative transporter, member of the sugar porter family [Komagataella phaffii GS115]AOA64307.1 GQ67_04010T0 [Komagataella phaffii]CAH2449240.1 Putative transporter [Komagataella phaffii CBS 7435]AOA68989.1 GQ68_03983T0 [Komagataella phaffii GS115]CAY70945.1 Putative transporter, member of the sugar porter family [Komagataella phaffii GS115]CCA39256.1 Putative transporter [Komagataella phaffii CBS 7435]
MHFDTQAQVTPTLGFNILVICLGSFLFGYHLSELNAPQRIISCRLHQEGPMSWWAQHPELFEQCIPMKSSQRAMITTMLSFGGLLGSLYSGWVATKIGRKKISILVSLGYVLSSVLLTIANSYGMLNLGRFIAGLSSGACLAVTPMLIFEITPVVHRGFMGTMMQLSICCGITTSQVMGYYYANDTQWRNIFLFNVLISLTYTLLLPFTMESPKWLITVKKDVKRATALLKKVRGTHKEVEGEVYHWRGLSVNQRHSKTYGSVTDTNASEFNSLPAIEEELAPSKSRRYSVDINVDNITVWQLLTIPRFHKDVIAIIGLMLSIQLTGQNSITFYGVDVLSGIFPQNTSLINIFLSVINIFITLVSSLLIDKTGRKPMLLMSDFLMIVGSFVLALSMRNDWNWAVVISVAVFVIGFSTGISSVPYLMIPEMLEHDVIPAAQALGATVNWTTGIIISYFFPIVNERLPTGEVYFIFTFICIMFFIFVVRRVPETKGKVNYNEVWKDYHFYT